MKFYGQFIPPVDQLLYENYFKDTKGGFFIECGAYDGLLDSCCKFFEENMGWSGMNIEASPRLFQRLIANRPTSFLNINVALSNKNGISVFNDVVSVADGNGSLNHKKEHMDQLVDRNCAFNKVEVKTVRFSDLVIERSITKIDLMILDVEGCEVEALEGMSGSPVMPKVMCIEFPLTGIERLKLIMTGLGYRFDFTREVNAFFVRETPS